VAQKFTVAQVRQIYGEAVCYELEGMDWLSQFDEEEIAECFNGIGPEFIGAKAREWISDFLALFLPCAMIHDMRNEYSDGTRQSFYYANEEFRRNCIKVVEANYGWLSRKRYRGYVVAEILYCFVSADCFGWEAWLQAKAKHEARQKISGNGAGETKEVQ